MVHEAARGFIKQYYMLPGGSGMCWDGLEMVGCGLKCSGASGVQRVGCRGPGS